MQENNLVRCMAALTCEPWLITPSMHKQLCDIVQAHVTRPGEQHAAAQQMAANPAPRAFTLAGDNVAVIPVDGVIGRKFSSTLYSSGVTSVDVLTRLINMAADDEEVNAILLAVDSPGGTVQGVAEAADAVKRANEIKPVIAYADGLMCSAAYWISCNAGAIYAYRDAVVGSIGVYSAYLDESRAYEMQGYRQEVFKSGEHKAMGMPGTSLTDEQRAMIQKSVDEIGLAFRTAVKTGRISRVQDEDMQGQAFNASEAKRKSLVDSVATFEQALKDAGWMGRQRKVTA